LFTFAETIVIVACLLSATASLGFTAWMIARVYTAHLPLNVVAGLVKQQEDAVKSRVKISNALLQGKSQEPLGDVEEAPVPPFYQSGSVTDMHEINRELRRHRNPQKDMETAIRDLGIGVEEA
jgi:hypothetical protein